MKRNTFDQIVFTVAVAAMFVAVTPLRALESDENIGASFKQTYVYRTYLNDDAITTDVKNGVVTLTGTVADNSNKAMAQDTASCLPGVIMVDNQLVTKAEANAENADLWMSRKVKLALLFHRNVSAGSTTVEVKDGVVTLTGDASSLAQKDLTTQYAGDIEGITAVNNMMSVVDTEVPSERTAGEVLDDASVTALVKAALLMHRSTSAADTTVVTRNGEVMLTGIAKNAAEKSLVSKLVGDIPGVTSVKNMMTIKEIITQ